MGESPAFIIETATQANLSDPNTREALAHWNGLRKNHGLPAWRDFDVLQLPRIIPHSFLINVLKTDKDIDFIYHLAGNQISNHYGDMTGKALDTDEARETIPERARDRAQLAFKAAYETRQAVISQGDLSIEIVGKTRYETVVLPFLNEDGDISNMLSVHVVL